MTPEQFIQKWKSATLTERAAAQSHFIDLCHLLDEPTPTDADPQGEFYCFERGATKSTGGEGWADVWKRGHFGWEYKGKRKDLNAAFGQLQQYALALENPPLLVVCDLDRFRIHTNWTNTISRVYEIALDDLREPDKRAILKAVLADPERLKPGQTRAELTEKAAGDFGELAKRLRERGHDPEAVAHFVNRLVFCMFAEDVGLLPSQMFRRMLDAARVTPADFQTLAADLFRAMRRGGRVGFETVEWFNGGLFDTEDALPLDHDDIVLALRVADLDWSEVDPSIFGTLFERGLDPDKRSQLGAHYTDRDKIMLIIEPVIIRPWLADWSDAKAKIEAAMSKSASAAGAARTRSRNQAESIYRAFLDRLRAFRVLDPACGSGNFLYLALLSLKDLELRVSIEAEALGLPREFPQIGPEVVKGVEINPYAAELARVTIWIGEIQWMRRNGFNTGRNPILKPLDTIECRDAILDTNGTEASWPSANVVVGNPPFLGGKRMRDTFGDAYVESLFKAYAGKIPAEADLVAYWVAKAWHSIDQGLLDRAGLVTTNSIRGGASRRVVDPIATDGVIFDAWDDEPWVVDGAAVRVSMLCFAKQAVGVVRLDGVPASRIAANLTATGVDLTKAVRLAENRDVAFMGDTKGGAFDIPGALAREWLALPVNPNGRPNADVLRPWMNGMDVTRRSADKWIIDFGWQMTEGEAALYERPFEHLAEHVRPVRMTNNRELYRRFWWRHVEPRPGLMRALAPRTRFIVTPEVSKHRVFTWLRYPILPDHKLQVVARDDDTTFGMLHSRIHEWWSLAVGSWHGAGNDARYTISTTFETFPFPEGLTPNIPATEFACDPRAQAIATAAARLNDLRENWLNPGDLVNRVPEVVPGYPDRLLPKDEAAAAALKKRTLTNLYNERPAWLAHAHAALDAAVAAAYGWPEDISEEDALARLFALNQERAK